MANSPAAVERVAGVRRRLVALLVLALGACGGDDCAGFISVNATPEACAMLAEQFGCQSFDVEGTSCGLTACATCEGL
jgi:hypothetical protein